MCQSLNVCERPLVVTEDAGIAASRKRYVVAILMMKSFVFILETYHVFSHRTYIVDVWMLILDENTDFIM